MTEVLDSGCFRLPKTDDMQVMYCRPAFLYLGIDRTIGNGKMYLSLRVLEKTEEDKQRKNFEELFRHCGHFANKRSATVEQHAIGEHRLLLTIGHIKKPAQCTLSSAIDLDKNHYLHASASFYTDASCYPNSENDWQKESLKREEVEATLQYLLALLKIVQFAGNYAEVLQQVRIEEEKKQQAEQQKERQEQLAKAVEPIDCDYFSLPSTENLTEVRLYREQTLLYFSKNAFYGVIDIRLRHYQEHIEMDNKAKLPFLQKLFSRKEGNAQKQQDFLQFFRNQILPKDSAGKLLDIPIENIALGCYFGYLTLHLIENREFQWTAAINVDSGHYLTFIANYRKIDESVFTQADSPAAAETYQYLQSVLNSVQIKTAATEQNLQTLEWENMQEAERIQWHQQHYTRAEQQAADPFHARHYPALFADLEKALKNFPDLSEETLQGIDSNARLAIGFMPTEVDDYSEKGNTRFYGLPDLPPAIEYPKYQNVLKDSPDGKSATRCKFLAQINFAELKGMQEYLPKSGILYLFIDSLVVTNIAFGGVLEPHMAFYYDGDRGGLQSAKDLGVKPEHI